MKLTDEYIFKQSIKNQAILLHIIAVVERQIPNIKLEFKWGIPYFYYNKKPFCYLNCSPKKGFVDVGFNKGFQLQKNQQFLIGDNRNTIKSLRYFTINEIDNSILESVIDEAKMLY